MMPVEPHSLAPEGDLPSPDGALQTPEGALRSPRGPLQEIRLIAGPAAASPPLPIALMLVALSIAGPFVFLKDGTPSLLLGIAALALAAAGMMTMLAAMRAQLRRRADAACRCRVSIGRGGITLHPTPRPADNQHFAWEHVAGAQLALSAFIVKAGSAAPQPGRHAIRFGKLVTPRADIISALEAIQPHPREPS